MKKNCTKFLLILVMTFCFLIKNSNAQTPMFSYSPGISAGLNIPLNNYSLGDYKMQCIYTLG
ncbi:MAG: hypothetical protein V4643_04025, partial [Bacteroidota bacterium]